MLYTLFFLVPLGLHLAFAGTIHLSNCLPSVLGELPCSGSCLLLRSGREAGLSAGAADARGLQTALSLPSDFVLVSLSSSDT